MNYDVPASAQEFMRPSAVDRLFTRRSRLHGFSEVAFQTHTLDVPVVPREAVPEVSKGPVNINQKNMRL